MVKAVQTGDITRGDLQRMNHKQLYRLFASAGRTTLVTARKAAVRQLAAAETPAKL